MIPSLSRLIPKDAFEAYNKRKVQESQIGDTKEDNEIEKRRLYGKQLMQKLRENILKKFRYAQHDKSISDMIVEETIPNLTYSVFKIGIYLTSNVKLYFNTLKCSWSHILEHLCRT